MKLIVLVFTLGLTLSSFAWSPYETLGSEYSDTISVSKTSVDMRVQKRGWITEGGIYPTLNLLSKNILTFDFHFNPMTINEAQSIFENLEKDALDICQKFGDVEAKESETVYPSSQYKISLELKNTVKYKDLRHTPDGLSAYISSECVVQLHLREKL